MIINSSGHYWSLSLVFLELAHFELTLFICNQNVVIFGTIVESIPIYTKVVIYSR